MTRDREAGANAPASLCLHGGITDAKPQFFPMKPLGVAARLPLAKGEKETKSRDHPPAADSTDGPP